MAGWILTDFSDLTGAYGVAGYSVLDALGVRIGHVSGWVTEPSGEIALLKVTVRDWFKSRAYLLPSGGIMAVEDERRHVTLRQLTRRALMKQCLPLEDDLPPPHLLRELIQFFPNPRPAVVERLADPRDTPDGSPPGRLTIRSDQGDGMSDANAEPFLEAGPPWTKLGRLAPPAWAPLSKFLRELGNRR